jgi:hypothetical protein
MLENCGHQCFMFLSLWRCLALVSCEWSLQHFCRGAAHDMPLIGHEYYHWACLRSWLSSETSCTEHPRAWSSPEVELSRMWGPRARGRRNVQSVLGVAAYGPLRDRINTYHVLPVSLSYFFSTFRTWRPFQARRLLNSAPLFLPRDQNCQLQAQTDCREDTNTAVSQERANELCAAF